jgi:hypothetical protein
MPENKGGVNENWMENRNQFMCSDQEECFDIDGILNEGVQHLWDVYSNGNGEIVNNFEQNVSLPEENVDFIPDLYFQSWTSPNVSSIHFLLFFIMHLSISYSFLDILLRRNKDRTSQFGFLF